MDNKSHVLFAHQFSELNMLTIWQYFRASNWTSWDMNRFMQKLQQLCFFPYFSDLDAEQSSRHHQVGGRSTQCRQHDIVETRNIIVGNMKRNDPATRRFIQYLLMRAGEVLVMVRDGKTGRVITAPPDDELWTYRSKRGLRRAAKNEWENILSIGPEFMKLTDMLCEWRFGFTDYYDVFIWDFVLGQPYIDTYSIVVLVSFQPFPLFDSILTSTVGTPQCLAYQKAPRNVQAHGASLAQSPPEH
jgi:hypothetical protein